MCQGNPRPIGACYQLETAQLRDQLAAMEARHADDLAIIARLEARLDRVMDDWCQLLVEYTGQAVRGLAGPAAGDGGHQ